MNEKCGKLLIKYIIDTGHTNRVENKHPHLTHAKQAEDHSGRNQEELAPSVFITIAVWLVLGRARNNRRSNNNAPPDPIQKTREGSTLKSIPAIVAHNAQPRHPNILALPYSNPRLRLTRSI